MITFKNYVRAQSLEEAYVLYQKKNNVVVGGMLWLKMEKRNKDTAIDLCDLGLDQIDETEDTYSIGAMVSLRKLELDERLEKETKGAIREAVESIVGVQFRNVATVGGSIYGRFGFSDVMTVFLALNARVELYHAGEMSLEEFMKMPRSTRDILVRVIVPKEKNRKIVYQSMRLTKTDFPVLTCAVAKQEEEVMAVIGATPAIARIHEDRTGSLKNEITEETARCFAKAVAEEINFGSNIRGSKEYRRQICEVLVRRGVLALKEEA